MAQPREVDRYERFLRENRQLGWAADKILEGIGEFSTLRTSDDFRAAVAGVLNSGDTETKGTSMRAVLERQLRPGKPDTFLLRCMSLACRAAEVATGHSPWHHQIVCALLLKRGMLVEMANGSGKTMAIALAAASSLGSERVHIATSNDYLAERDARWMAPLFDLLGLSVGVLFTSQSPGFECGVIVNGGAGMRVRPKDAAAQDPGSRSTQAELTHEPTAAYDVDQGLTLKSVLQCPVVYGKIEAFAFAYLRDHLVISATDQVLTQRDTLIIDECDTVLLDDLRTPLILNRPRFARVAASDLVQLHHLALRLLPQRDFVVNGKQARLTYNGLAEVQRLTGLELFTLEAGQLAVGLQNALTAAHAQTRDVDYIVHEDQIILIEQSSGRLLHGRRASDGLHEALEIKEGLVVRGLIEMEVLAKIAIKHFVKTYLAVAGTSGSLGVAQEYLQLYGLNAVSVEPYSLTRRDHPDLVYRTRREAVEHGVIGTALEASARGQPVLINVPTLKDVTDVARLLEAAGATYQALDATTIRTLGDEAEKARRAGSKSLITISSKIAARGTDIVLDPVARECGGLFVIGLEREIDRRYDNQLRGRAGRHGDPGDSLFVLSLEDELMQRVGAANISRVMQSLGMDDGVPVEAGMVTRGVARAQRQTERLSHQHRLQVVEIEDLLDRHRHVVYRVRQQLLVKSDLRPEVETIIDNWINVHLSRPDAALSSSRLASQLEQHEIDRIENVRNKRARERMLKDALKRYAASALEATSTSLVELRVGILTILDSHWLQYLQFEEGARQELSLYTFENAAAIAQYSRLMEEHFDSFFHDVGEDVLVSTVYWLRHRTDLVEGRKVVADSDVTGSPA